MCLFDYLQSFKGEAAVLRKIGNCSLDHTHQVSREEPEDIGLALVLYVPVSLDDIDFLIDDLCHLKNRLLLGLP
jgi:hypothetical protein